MFSEMMLFMPFSDEAKLEPLDHDRCWEVYQRNLDGIERIKSLVMPHLKSVTDARLEYEIECAEGQLNDIGREMDAEKELEEDACELEGVAEHVDFRVKDLALLLSSAPPLPLLLLFSSLFPEIFLSD